MKEFLTGILGLVILLVGLNLLAGIGYLVRKGKETKKALQQVKKQIEAQGATVNDLWKKKNRDAGLMIYGSFLGIGVVLLFLIASGLWIFLLGLIPIVLGYFGIVWIPDID